MDARFLRFYGTYSRLEYPPATRAHGSSPLTQEQCLSTSVTWFYNQPVVNRNRHHWTLALIAMAGLIVPKAQANGILRDGYGTNSMAMGGTGVAFASDPLGALSANPATLTLLDQPTITLGLTGIQGFGDFDNDFNRHTGLGRDFGAFPEFAASYPVQDSR